jgi:DNA-binding transcriptional regulator YdaS (Cro superfamily)
MNTPLIKAIGLCGGQARLAEKIGTGQATVSAWVNRFNHQVGVEFVLKAAAATSWQVTPHQLRPDIYPHPYDGLPEPFRTAATVA